ncbi:MAG: hypothetical protein IPP17_00040 [Bacteroidetes bacterium]|nr:hypothetical protein [Bacteroidota bacterium]
MISLLLMMLVMFYPYFTGSPMEKAKGKAQVEREQARQDSLNRLMTPPALDSAGIDTGK